MAENYPEFAVQGSSQSWPAGAAQLYAQAQNLQGQPPAPTLIGAMGKIDELNKRLHAMRQRVVEIAQAIGGPYPAAALDPNVPPSVSAIDRMYQSLAESHGTVNEIENALDAIRRSLGG